MEFQISKKAKTWTTALMVVGLIFTIIGVIIGMKHGRMETRLMANLVTNSVFFLIIGVSALFFLALQYATESGWFQVIKRPIEAITGYIPMGSGILLIILLTITFLNGSGVYDWMNPEIMNEGGAHYDEVAAGKGSYLNKPFFWVRTIAYLAVYYIMWKGFIKRSILTDEKPELAVDLHFKNYRRGALFLVFYAVFSSTSAWDWIMSIDVHWYTTLFGWYVFAGGWATAMVAIVLLMIYLKKLGYLPKMNASHFHDMGKWMFATSFLWTYMWYCMFMLIWYANIPEEVAYYVTRVHDFKLLYFGMMLVNFILPILMLMSRDGKRHTGILGFLCVVLIGGHWVDMWIMVMGGSFGPASYIGFLEIGLAVLFIGLFIRVIFYRLAQAPLMAEHEPFLEESIHHEI